MTTKRFHVTGGAGFIGSAVVRHLIHDTGHEVCVLDKLTMRASPGRVPNLSVERDIFTASILVRAYVVAERAKCASRSCPWELQRRRWGRRLPRSLLHSGRLYHCRGTGLPLEMTRDPLTKFRLLCANTRRCSPSGNCRSRPITAFLISILLSRRQQRMNQTPDDESFSVFSSQDRSSP